MLRWVILVVLAAAAVAAPSQCGIIGDVQRCAETTCYWAKTNSSCDGNVYIDVSPSCDETIWVWFRVVFGDAMFDLYESPERFAAGYASAADAFEWSSSISEGELVNCTLVNQTAYLIDENGQLLDTSSEGDDDESSRAIWWAPMIVIVGCISMSVCLIIGIIGAIVAVLKKKDSFGDHL